MLENLGGASDSPKILWSRRWKQRLSRLPAVAYLSSIMAQGPGDPKIFQGPTHDEHTEEAALAASLPNPILSDVLEYRQLVRKQIKQINESEADDQGSQSAVRSLLDSDDLGFVGEALRAQAASQENLPSETSDGISFGNVFPPIGDSELARKVEEEHNCFINSVAAITDLLKELMNSHTQAQSMWRQLLENEKQDKLAIQDQLDQLNYAKDHVQALQEQQHMYRLAELQSAEDHTKAIQERLGLSIDTARSS